jgi:hypothetical protein
MIDFRHTTTVHKNFDFEKTITENKSIRADNKVLVIIGISAAAIIIGLCIYYANEEYKHQKKYTVSKY